VETLDPLGGSETSGDKPENKINAFCEIVTNLKIKLMHIV
jgi:hypothetical protein